MHVGAHRGMSKSITNQANFEELSLPPFFREAPSDLGEGKNVHVSACFQSSIVSAGY